VTTALIWDERFFWFDAGSSMPPLPGCEPYPAFDRPDTKRRIKSLLDASGLIDRLAVMNPRLPHGAVVSRGCMTAVDAVLAGDASNAYACLPGRPAVRVHLLCARRCDDRLCGFSPPRRQRCIDP
jgi:hypothetical protein